MDALNFFILNAHQVFFALLAVVFSIHVLYGLNETKESNSREKRVFYVGVFTAMFIGLSYIFYESWEGIGMFFAIEFAFFTIFGLLSPKYAASFFLFLLLTRPWETYGNQLMETMPRDYFYVVILSLIGHKLASKRFYIRFNLGTALAGGFAVWVFFSAFFSNHAAEAINEYIVVFSKGIIVFFVIQNCFEKSSDLVAAKAALVLAILEMGIISARNTFMLQRGSVAAEEFQRLESVGILANSNDIAAILVLALPFCVFFFLRRAMRIYLWPISLGSSGLICALIWSSQSRGALLSLIAVIGAYFLTKITSRKSLLMVCAAGVVGATLAFSFLQRNGADLEGSTNNRIIYWKAGANMAVRNPVFGVGFWGFNHNFAAYAVGGDTGTEGDKMTAHSAWVQVMAENGFVGIFLFGSLWAYGLAKAWSVRKREPEYFMSVAGYGVAITFLSHGYLLYPYILLSLTITQSFLSREELDYGYQADLLPSLTGAQKEVLA